MKLPAAILALALSLIATYSYVGAEAGKQGAKVIKSQQQQIEQVNYPE